MGLTWSEHEYIGEHGLTQSWHAYLSNINGTLRMALWQMWNSHRHELRNDGFWVAKRHGIWYVGWRSKVTDPGHNDALEFEEKKKKWGIVLDDFTHELDLLMGPGPSVH